jgi:hypothetical protein
VKEGIEARKRREAEFHDLAKNFRAAKDPVQVKRAPARGTASIPGHALM